MKKLRVVSIAFLSLLFLLSLGAGLVAPASYATQFRESPNAPASRQHWLGTDDLGRDRFSRLLYGTRVSLLLAPAAALLSTFLAGLIGALSGYKGGVWEKLAIALTDFFLAMPWLFLLLLVRAMLPLNVSPAISVSVTFFLLGILGWAMSSRVLIAGARKIRNSEFMLLAHASGMGGFRLFWRYVVPNLGPLLAAQFWVLVPVFILTEANLSVLGLGVAEPLPSWGGLLRELENLPSLSSEPLRLVSLILLVLAIAALQQVITHEENPL